MVKKNLFIIASWSLLIAASAAQGMPTYAPDIHAERIQSIRPFDLNRESRVLAENDQKSAENRSQSTSEKKDQAAAPEAAGKEKNSSDGAAAKPLKPFKPSEEIAAEQAVDFPVDI